MYSLPGPNSERFPKALIFVPFPASWPKDFCGRGTGAGGTGTLSRCFVLPDVFFASNDMQGGSAVLRLNACSLNGVVVHLHARLIQHCSRGAPLDVPVALCKSF